MKVYNLALALAAAGIVAVTFMWPDTPSAEITIQKKGKPALCYKPAKVAAKTTPMAKLPPPGICAGVISGKNCIVCPGYPGSGVIQVVKGKSVSCYQACKAGTVWNGSACCPGTPGAPPVVK